MIILGLIAIAICFIVAMNVLLIGTLESIA